MSTYTSVVWFVQGEGSKLSFREVDASQSDTLVDVTNQCLGNYILVSMLQLLSGFAVLRANLQRQLHAVLPLCFHQCGE